MIQAWNAFEDLVHVSAKKAFTAKVVSTVEVCLLLSIVYLRRYSIFQICHKNVSNDGV